MQTDVATPSQKAALKEAAADLSPGFTLEALIVAAFRRWPKLFALKEFPEYPDSNRALTLVYAKKNGLKPAGYLVPVGDGLWEYNPRPGSVPPVLVACRTQPALHTSRDGVTFGEAVRLWECAGTRGSLADKVGRFHAALREAAEEDEGARRVLRLSEYLAGKFARYVAA